MTLRTITCQFVAILAAGACGLGCLGLSVANAQQVGDAFVVFNVDTGEIRMNSGNAGISQGDGIASYGIRPDPAVIEFSSTASDFSYLSGSYPLFPPTLGNVTAGDDNTLGAAFYTLGSPNVNASVGYFNHNNLVNGTAAVAGTGGGASWGPGNGGVVSSEIPGTYFGTPEWSFGTVGDTGMSLTDALTAFGATTQGGLSASSQMVYGINGVTGTQNFRVYTVSAVPEPSTIAMACCGIAALGGLAWRNRRRARQTIAAATS